MKNKQKGSIFLYIIFLIIILCGFIYVYGLNNREDNFIEKEENLDFVEEKLIEGKDYNLNKEEVQLETDNKQLVEEKKENKSDVVLPQYNIPEAKKDLNENIDETWDFIASDINLFPTVADNTFHLTAFKEGDISGIKTKIYIPENAQALLFDMNFIEEGDGDYLLVELDDETHYVFSGSSFFDNGKDHTSEISTIGKYLGKTVRLDVYLLGEGEKKSELTLKNFRLVRIETAY